MKRKDGKKYRSSPAQLANLRVFEPIHQKGHVPTNYKHGINSRGFKPCDRCADKAWCKRRGELKVNDIDRCIIEKEMADYIYNTFNEEFNLTKSEQVQCLWIVETMIRSIRASNWITDNGLTQKQFIKDEKGKVYENIIASCLDKSMYYLNRDVREWLQELKLSRKSKEEKRAGGTDVALFFTNIKKDATTTKK